MFWSGIGQNVSVKATTFERELNKLSMGRGLSNISINTRMKQFLVLIACILGGILFALSTDPASQQKLKTKLQLETELNSQTPARK